MADLTETFVASQGEFRGKSGQWLKCGLYTATKAAANDTVTLGDYTVVKHCVITQETGVGNKVYEDFKISATTTNEVILLSARTGTTTLLVWGY